MEEFDNLSPRSTCSDLGDAFRFSLKYQTKPPPPANVLNFSQASSMATSRRISFDKSIPNEHDCLDDEVDNLIQSLGVLITQSKESYALPENYQNWSTFDKVKLAQNIIGHINMKKFKPYFSYLSTQASPIRDENEAVSVKCIQGDQDVIQKLLNSENSGAFLLPEQVQQLNALLIGAVRDSPSRMAGKKYQELQVRHEEMINLLVQTRQKLRQKLNENEKLHHDLKVFKSQQNINRNLIYQQQVQSLEKQLEESLMQFYHGESQYQDARDEVKQLRLLCRELMASPNRDLADISYRENIEYLDRLNSISERTMPASCDASPLEEKKITY